MNAIVIRTALLTLGFGALTAGTVTSQAFAPAGPSAGAGIAWETFRFGTPSAANLQSLSLLTVPVGAQLPLAGVGTVSVRSHWARGVLERADGSTAELTGLTDTEVRIGVNFGPPNLATTLTVIGVAPTGNATHSAEEAEVAGAIAADLLPFRISHWGTGGAIGAGAGISSGSPAGSIGASAAYVVGREFEPLELGADARFAYRPGNQLQLRGAFDRYVGGGKVTLAAVAQIHADDQREGTNLYRAGNRYHAIGSYAFSTGGRSTALLYGGALRRERGTALLELVAPAPAQTLFLAGAGFRHPLGPVLLLPSLDARLHRSEDGVGQGYRISAGTALELPTGSAAFVPLVRLHLGNVLVRTGQESPLTGIELGLTTRLRRR